MTHLANERVAYHNGKFLPESEVVISFRDRGFKFGEAVFDTARTISHKPFKLREHVARLYKSLRYLNIDPKLTPDEMITLSEEVLKRNAHLLGPDDDYWLYQRITPGTANRFAGEDEGEPTVIIECTPIPFAARAPLFRDGIKAYIPATRRTPPDAQSPRAKTHNYLNLLLADQEVKAIDPLGWAILLDHNGAITEGLGSNVFFVRDSELFTPQARFVLPGISRDTVIDIARDADIPVHEIDIDMYDALTADECFFTSTSLCMVPVTSLNGRPVGDGAQGPVTTRLIESYSKLLGLDFVEQYLKRL